MSACTNDVGLLATIPARVGNKNITATCNFVVITRPGALDFLSPCDAFLPRAIVRGSFIAKKGGFGGWQLF